MYPYDDPLARARNNHQKLIKHDALKQKYGANNAAQAKAAADLTQRIPHAPAAMVVGASEVASQIPGAFDRLFNTNNPDVEAQKQNPDQSTPEDISASDDMDEMGNRANNAQSNTTLFTGNTDYRTPQDPQSPMDAYDAVQSQTPDQDIYSSQYRDAYADAYTQLDNEVLKPLVGAADRAYQQHLGPKARLNQLAQQQQGQEWQNDPAKAGFIPGENLGDFAGKMGQEGYGLLKGTTRVGFVGMESLLQHYVTGPVRGTAEAFKKDMGFMEGLRNINEEMQKTDARYAAEQLSKGNRVNLGQGFFPNSKLTTSDLRKYSDSEHVPEDLSDTIETYGVPIMQRSKREREEWKPFDGDSYSPGRHVAYQFTDPGTVPYDMMSGALDASIQILGDPAAKASLGLSKINKARKTFNAASDFFPRTRTAYANIKDLGLRNMLNDESARLPGKASRDPNFIKSTGLINGSTRKSVFSPTVESFWEGKRGRKVSQWLAAQDDYLTVKKYTGLREPSEIEFVRNNKYPDTIKKYLKNRSGKQLPYTPELPRFGKDFNIEWIERAISGVPDAGKIHIWDKERSADELNQMMSAMNFSRSRRSDYLSRWAKVKKGDRAGSRKIVQEIQEEGAEKVGLLPPKKDVVGEENRILGELADVDKKLNEVNNRVLDQDPSGVIANADQFMYKEELLARRVRLNDDLTEVRAKNSDYTDHGAAPEFQAIFKRKFDELIEEQENLRRYIQNRASDPAVQPAMRLSKSGSYNFEDEIQKSIASTQRNFEDMAEDAALRGDESLSKRYFEQAAAKDPEQINAAMNNRLDKILARDVEESIYVMDPYRFMEFARSTQKGPLSLMIRASKKFPRRELYEESGISQVVSKFMQDFWKPAVLLRPAWPMKVIPEENVRQTFAGYSGAVDDPLGYMANIIGDLSRTRFNVTKTKPIEKIGVPKVERREYTWGDLAPSGTPLSRSATKNETTNQAFSHWRTQWSEDLDLARVQDIVQRPRTPAHNPAFYEAWAQNISQEAQRPIAQMVATNKQYLVDNWFKKSGDAKEDIDKIKKSLFDETPEDLHPRLRKALSTKRGVQNFMNAIEARIHRVAGGEIEHFQRGGVPINAAEGAQARADEIIDGGEEIVTSGDQDIVDAISRGKFYGVRQTPGEQPKYDIINGDTDEFKQFAEELRENYYNVAPATALSARPRRSLALPDKQYRQAGMRNTMFSVMNTVPSNYFNRSPLYNQAFYRAMIDRFPVLGKENQERAIRNAAKSGLPRKQQREMAAKYGHVSDETMSLEDAERLAHGEAQAEVKDLLYDMSVRSRFGAEHRALIPFFDAMIEVTSAWARLLNPTNPRSYRNLRRIQQTLQGGRESEVPGTDNHYISTNSYGDEVVNIPSQLLPVGFVSEQILGSTPGETGNTQPQAQIPLANMNMVTGFGPGFGPVAQIPAANLIPEVPQTQWIKELMFPYGPERSELESMGDIPLQGAPTWARNILQATQFGEDFERKQIGTNIDVLKTMAANGEVDLSTLEGKNAAIDKAKNAGKFLTLIRAFGSAFLPAPPRYEFESEDKHGTARALNDIAEYYRKLQQEEGYSENEALGYIKDELGYRPDQTILFSESESKRIRPAPLTKEGYNKKLEHKETFEQYPNTAYYAFPDDPDDEFSFKAHMDQYDQGSREQLTERQFTHRLQNTMARLTLERHKQILKNKGHDPNKGKAKQYLQALRDELKERYPDYENTFKNTAVGEPSSASFQDKLDELKNWEDSEVLSNTDVGKAVNEYLTRREKVIEYLESPELDMQESSLSRAKAAAPFREYLRATGKALTEEVPEFQSVWDRVLSREIDK